MKNNRPFDLKKLDFEKIRREKAGNCSVIHSLLAR